MNIEKLIRPNILKLKPYASARTEFSGKASIYLDANESPYGAFNRYPDPYQQDLKKKIAEIKSISTSNIFLGNGSDEILDLAFRIFCRPGMDKALSFFPSYGMYDVSAAINDVELIQLPLNANFQIDFDVLKMYLYDPQLKLLLICSPNNPTGNTLEGLEAILSEFPGIVIIDEAYIDFSQKPSWLSTLDDYPNLITLQTLSKSYGLAALRIGMAFAGEAIINYFNRVKPPYNISLVNQEAALKSLSDYSRITSQINEVREQRALLAAELQSMGLTVYPSDANFLLVEVNNSTQVYQTLVGRGIIIRNRNSVMKNCIRITVGTPAENFELIKALKEIV